MPTTVSQLKSEFPEIARVDNVLLTAKLADAEQLTAVDYDSNTRDLRVKYLAMELIVLSPTGEFARLDPKKEPDGATSLYQRQRIQIDKANAYPLVI